MRTRGRRCGSTGAAGCASIRRPPSRRTASSAAAQPHSPRAANTFWNNQVVAFGEAQQRWLLDRLNLGDGGQQLGIALVLALIVFFAAMSVYLGWRFRPRTKDPLAQIYDQLCRKLARRGLARAAYEGPSDYLGRVLQARPDLAPLLVEARNLYVALRYGPRSWGPLLGRSELSRLKFLINQLKV